MFHLHICAPLVYLVCAEARRGIRDPGNEVSDGCKPPCGAGTRTQVLNPHPPTSLSFCLHLYF